MPAPGALAPGAFLDCAARRSSTPSTMNPQPFTPVTHVTTTSRSRDGEETTTSVVRETHYEVVESDNLILGLQTLVLERGACGENYRETLRLYRYEGDFVVNAVIGLLQHCVDELRSEQFGSDYRRRCEDLLQHVARILPSHVLEASERSRMTVTISETPEA